MPRRLRIPQLLITLLACAALATSVARAAVPPIMSYNGELQGAGGAPLASGSYSMKFSLYSTLTGGTPIWTEVHNGVVVTGGSFHVLLGSKGPATLIGVAFDKPYFLGVSVGSDPEMTPRQPLVTLPYTFRAGLADQVANGSITTEKIGPVAVTDEKVKSVSWAKLTGIPSALVSILTPTSGSDGVPANVWSLKGNRSSNPPSEFLGTTDAKPLVIKVNNSTLMNLAVGGPISVTTGFAIAGDFTLGGNATLHGTLGVDKATSLHSTLGVDGATSLGNTLGVTGATTLGNTLGVTGRANLRGGTSTNVLFVQDRSPGALALIDNGNEDTGDGLIIKLGKTHPAWDSTHNIYIQGFTTTDAELDKSIEVLHGWIVEHKGFSFPNDILNLIPVSALAGTLCNLADGLFKQVNEELGLGTEGITIGPYGFNYHLLPSFGVSFCGGPNCDITVIPRIPLIPALPDLSTVCNFLPKLDNPNLEFVSVSNSLTHQNEYIAFVDKQDRPLGAIRAESISEWETRYLTGNYLLNAAAGFVGIDLSKAGLGIYALFSNITVAYNHIGVEYMSGHGDYAEWLERLDHGESIAAGDIVAVKGGKITKNMDGAEQVMAVSEHPIVLGNMPPAHMEAMGHNVAFMGQIPVKVQGSVRVGDFIVARSDIPGYGIAVNPADMTPDDFRLCVGRSWETQERGGPKLVNTVVGVQNGDFVRILKKTIDANQTLQARMQVLEERMDRVTGSSAANATFKTASADR